MKPPRWSSRTVKLAAKLWAGNRTARQIAADISTEHHQYSEAQVGAYIDSHRELFPYKNRVQKIDVARMVRKIPWTHDQVLKAAKLWYEGALIREIAEALSLKERQVVHMMGKHRSIFPYKHGPRATAGIRVRRPGAFAHRQPRVDTEGTQAA